MAQGYVYEDAPVGWRPIAATDLPASGVTAATYGDASHVAQVAVNAEGLVTGASNVPISAASGITTLTSSGGSLTVTNPSGPTANADVAASGVTAATYGDSTHVAQVHVGADGRVTNATQVAISGSAGAGGLIVLYDSGYLGADAATIDTGVGGVPAGHFCLMVVGYLRSTGAVFGDNVNFLLNNDTAAHYTIERLQVSGATVTGTGAAAQSAGLVGSIPGASATASYFGICEGRIPAYDNTSNFKAARWDAQAVDSAAAGVASSTANTWSSAAAVSQFSLSLQTVGAKFKAGSRMIVYGTQ